MIIAIGSTRRPKIDAVRAAVDKLLVELTPDSEERVTYITRSVTSGVDETPTTVEALMTGARNRAVGLTALQKDGAPTADYFVGVEGGFHKVGNGGDIRTFLQTWAYVYDGSIGYFGSSANIEVPTNLARLIYDERMSLGEAIDALSGRTNVKDREGAFGVLTRDHISRKAMSELAVAAAFAPFCNREMYGGSVHIK